MCCMRIPILVYLKNWIVYNRCTHIYHKNEKREFALLHTQDCLKNVNRCSEKLPLCIPAQEDSPHGVWHLELDELVNDGRVNWQAMEGIIETKNEE